MFDWRKFKFSQLIQEDVFKELINFYFSPSIKVHIVRNVYIRIARRSRQLVKIKTSLNVLSVSYKWAKVMIWTAQVSVWKKVLLTRVWKIFQIAELVVKIKLIHLIVKLVTILSEFPPSDSSISFSSLDPYLNKLIFIFWFISPYSHH